MQRLNTVDTLALKLGDLDRIYSGDLLRRCIQWTEIDRLSEGEIIGMEHPAPSVRQRAVAEHVEQRRPYVAGEVAGLDAHLHFAFQRRRRPTASLRVVAGHPA